MSDATNDPTPSEEGDVIEVTALSSGGDGVARLPDGRVVFVEGGVPGDRVTLAEVDVRKRWVRARIGRLIEPSPHRVTPRCPHFGDCGGCLWQHVAYDTQLEAKRQAVTDALERIGGLALDTKVEIVPSPSPYAYRARARWVECEGGLGYRARGGDGARAVDVCPVLVPGAETALVEQSERVHAASGGRGQDASPGQRPRRAREWVVTTGSDGTPIVTPAGARRAKRRAAGAPRAVFVEVAGERLRVGGDSFVQGNALLWEPLVLAVRAACVGGVGSSPRRFVELYAGVGFFTLPLARAGLEGEALESDPSSLADLASNLDRAGLREGVEIVAGRVERRGDLAERLRRADLVLVDPPRTGLDGSVRAALADAGPPRLVYLSCDPGTLARDLGALAGAGYAVGSVEAFDLFPQTPHVETLVVLTRDAGRSVSGAG